MKVKVSRTPQKIFTMRVGEDGELLVNANNKLSLAEIRQLVESHRDWISAHLPEKSNRKTTLRNNIGSYEDLGEEISDMFCAKKTLLEGVLCDVKASSVKKSFVEGQTVYIYAENFSTKENRIKALKQYIKKYTTQNVSEKISTFGSYVSLCPTKIEFKNLTTGWLKCSCPNEKIITFDYRISQLPNELQHYLIVHAFSHFSNAEHDDAFWNTVSNYLPSFRQCAGKLQSYDFLKEILP